MSDDYPIGAVVRYSDRGTVEQDTAGPITAVGRINGPVFTFDLPSGETIIRVPVWTERDHGREATTIMVHPDNIISVEVSR